MRTFAEAALLREGGVVLTCVSQGEPQGERIDEPGDGNRIRRGGGAGGPGGGDRGGYPAGEEHLDGVGAHRWPHEVNNTGGAPLLDWIARR